MDAKPPATDRHVIQVHVAELRQLFNSMDPTPFDDRDLDPAAEAFIVEWARELPRHAPPSLCIHVDALPDDIHRKQALVDSIQGYFQNRAHSSRRQLRHLFQRGRTSLLIGLGFLFAALLASEMLADLAHPTRVTNVLRETLSIGGWVAMWRPLEIFLYDWWPIRADIHLFERLGRMPVDLRRGDAA